MKLAHIHPGLLACHCEGASLAGSSFPSLCLLFPLFGFAFLLPFPPLLEAFLISVASIFRSSPPGFILSSLSAFSSLRLSLTSLLPSSLFFPSFSFYLSPFHFLSQAFCFFCLFPFSQPPLLLLFLLSSHLLSPPVHPCVPPLGDPLPIHHYFHGYLAGFSVRSGRLESREVIECLYACREGLDYRDFESLGKGMKVSSLPLALSFPAHPLAPTPAPPLYLCSLPLPPLILLSAMSMSGAQVHVNPSQSLLTLEGDDVETFNHALQHVAYMNTLRFATPGVRPLRLTTAVK